MIGVRSVLMSRFKQMSWRARISIMAAAILLATVVIRTASDAPEIALMIGEPWEAMRQRSTASIDPAIAGQYWGRLPRSDARLRFLHSQYGFVTPPARFFTVSFDNSALVRGVRISPQVEPLLLEDALEVVLDLQEQWRRGGWKPIRPPIEGTAEWRARLRDVNQGGTTYWQAGDLYQVMLDVGRFRDDKRPKEERYLITLSIAKPWVKP